MRNYDEDPVKVGEHATYCIGSDRYPFEVIEVSDSGKTIVLRELDATPADGYDYYSNQVFTYSSNEKNRTMKATLRKDKRYRQTGCRNYGPVSIGFARKYMDPSF